MNRTKNASRNVFWGLVNMLFSRIMPFVVRTIIIRVLGIQYAGLGSLFTSLLSMLSLAELGIGSALTYGMYKPAATENTKELSALLNLYKKCYRIIGFIVLALGVVMIPFLRYTIKDGYPDDINIYLLFAIYLFNTTISYFMYAYKSSVLIAFQRTDIKSNIATILIILQNMMQIIVLVLFKNYYYYILVTPIISVLTNILTSMYVDRNYPEIKCAGEVDRETKDSIITNVKGMIFQKIGGIVLTSVDNIVISAFLGLVILGVYNNYYLILYALDGMLNTVMNAIIPSVGNAINTKSVDDNYKDFCRFNLTYYWIVVICSCCLIGLYQPFIELWVGEEYVLSNRMMCLFVANFFIHKWMDMGYVYQEATGMWWHTRYIPLLAATLNLTVNIILVNTIGLAGVLISTIVSVLFVYNVGFAYVMFKQYFKRSALPYVFRQGLYLITAALTITATYLICRNIVLTPIIALGVRLIICVAVSNIFMFVFWNRTEEFKGMMPVVINVLKNKKTL